MNSSERAVVVNRPPASRIVNARWQPRTTTPRRPGARKWVDGPDECFGGVVFAVHVHRRFLHTPPPNLPAATELPTPGCELATATTTGYQATTSARLLLCATTAPPQPPPTTTAPHRPPTFSGGAVGYRGYPGPEWLHKPILILSTRRGDRDQENKSACRC